MGRFSYLKGNVSHTIIYDRMYKQLSDIRRMIIIGDSQGALDYINRLIKELGNADIKNQEDRS